MRGCITIMVAALLVGVASGCDAPFRDGPPTPPAAPGEDLPGPLDEEELIRDEDRWIPQPRALPQWEDELPFVEPVAVVSPLQLFTVHQRIASRHEQIVERYAEFDEIYAEQAVRPEVAIALDEIAGLRSQVAEEYEAMEELAGQVLVMGTLFVTVEQQQQLEEHARRLAELHGQLQQLELEVAIFHFDDDLRELANRHFEMADLHGEMVERYRAFYTEDLV